MIKLMIGEFSNATGVSKRMLRHYDKLNLLPPAIIEEQSGYRYYTEAQISIVERIQFFQEFGFSLKDIGAILNKPLNAETFLRQLKDQEACLRNDKDAMTRHLLKLQYFIAYIESHPEETFSLSDSDYAIHTQPQEDLSIAPFDFTYERSTLMNTTLNKQAMRNELHQLTNHDIFLESIEENLTIDAEHPAYLITLDIDNFIDVNNSFGFDVGDRTIYSIYRILKDCLGDLSNDSSANLFTRFGGDEFGIFITNRDDAAITALCSQILLKVNTFDFKSIGCMTPVTVSIGVAKTLKPVGHAHLLRQASTIALLDVKRAHKNDYHMLTV